MWSFRLGRTDRTVRSWRRRNKWRQSGINLPLPAVKGWWCWGWGSLAPITEQNIGNIGDGEPLRRLDGG
jgi:hypothetical protein